MPAPERSSTPAGPLARLADLAVRRRGLMVVAWVVILAATIALAPRVAGDFAADYSTPGAEFDRRRRSDRAALPRHHRGVDRRGLAGPRRRHGAGRPGAR